MYYQSVVVMMVGAVELFLDQRPGKENVSTCSFFLLPTLFFRKNLRFSL